MADLIANTQTSLPPEEVMVRAVQFFTNENWRAQSQTNRIATFVGLPRFRGFTFCWRFSWFFASWYRA